MSYTEPAWYGHCGTLTEIPAIADAPEEEIRDLADRLGLLWINDLAAMRVAVEAEL